MARLYGVETKVLNQAVKRNIARFPQNFRFQLSKDELSNLVTNCDRFVTLKHSTTLPYAFTEQGVAMLSAVLKSATAVEVSVRIMEAFISMRRFISQNAGLFQRVELLEKHQRDTEEKIEQVLTRMDELSPAPTTEQLFSTGCVWDAYTFFPNIEKIVIAYEIIHKSVFGNQKETHTLTYSPNSQADFIIECLNGECTSGYFDLKNVISTMVCKKLSISEGTLDCKGSEAPDHLYQSCSGTLTYKISIAYK